MSLYIHDDVEVEREVIALEDYLYDSKFKLIIEPYAENDPQSEESFNALFKQLFMS